MSELETRLDKLETRMNSVLVLQVIGIVVSILLFALKMAMGMNATPAQNTQDVRIGETSALRDYLSTDEVAEREGVTARTVTSWINGNKVFPPPTRQGRAWIIAEDYRILPTTAEPEETAQK